VPAGDALCASVGRSVLVLRHVSSSLSWTMQTSVPLCRPSLT
jgi:hypothetical protein